MATQVSLSQRRPSWESESTRGGWNSTGQPGDPGSLRKRESQKEKVTEEEVDVPESVSLWTHSRCCKWHYSLLLHDWVRFCCTYVRFFFTHSLVDGHWSCFHELARVNSAAMNTGLPGFRIMVFSGYIHRSGIAGSYGSLGNWDWYIHTTICKIDN